MGTTTFAIDRFFHHLSARSQRLQRLALILIAAVAYLPTAALALPNPLNGVERGGGDAFVCQTSSGERVFLADTYEYFSPSGDHYAEFRAQLSALQRLPEASILRAALASLRISSDPAEYESVQDFVRLVKIDLGGPLEDLKDDGIRYPPGGCKKLQLAIQESAGRVLRVDQDLYSRLSPAERAIFQIHEGYILYRMRHEAKATNSKVTRARVRALTLRMMKHVFRLSVEPFNSPSGTVLYALLAMLEQKSFERIALMTDGLEIRDTARLDLALLSKRLGKNIERSEIYDSEAAEVDDLAAGIANFNYEIAVAGELILGSVGVKCLGAPESTCYLNSIKTADGRELLTNRGNSPVTHKALPSEQDSR